VTTATKILSIAAVAAALVGAPTAQALDLTTAGASGFIGDAFFQQVDPQTTGTGVIDPFVRIQNNGTESGFNTDYRPLTGDLADVNSSVQFTKSIKVNEFGTVDLNGTQQIRFLLDINQLANSPLLSLDEMMIVTAGRGNINTFADLMSEGTMIYNMDAGGDNEIMLNYLLNPGSGAGDMMAYVPANLFAGKGDQYLYLYSKFGATARSNDGFEEWARIDGFDGPTDPPPVVPEPATLMLVGGGLLGAAASRRRRRRA
jgi:hypothetical protein